MLYVLTGPESTGKTTLATDLSTHFNAPLVAEQARAYLTGQPHYLPSDLIHLALMQSQAEQLQVQKFHAEERVARSAHGSVDGSVDGWEESESMLFADTDLQVLYIWWREKYGAVPRSLVDAYYQQSPRCYLLCEPDLAWEADPQRENRHDRRRLYELYCTDLDGRGLTYSVISGSGEERLNAALLAIAEL